MSKALFCIWSPLTGTKCNLEDFPDKVPALHLEYPTIFTSHAGYSDSSQSSAKTLCTPGMTPLAYSNPEISHGGNICSFPVKSAAPVSGKISGKGKVTKMVFFCYAVDRNAYLFLYIKGICSPPLTD